ncbi:MAG: hypothetical protein MHMPM18_003042 [Marteilia pararefringens]
MIEDSIGSFEWRKFASSFIYNRTLSLTSRIAFSDGLESFLGKVMEIEEVNACFRALGRINGSFALNKELDQVFTALLRNQTHSNDKQTKHVSTKWNLIAALETIICRSNKWYKIFNGKYENKLSPTNESIIKKLKILICEYIERYYPTRCEIIEIINATKKRFHENIQYICEIDTDLLTKIYIEEAKETSLINIFDCDIYCLKAVFSIFINEDYAMKSHSNLYELCKIIPKGKRYDFEKKMDFIRNGIYKYLMEGHDFLFVDDLDLISALMTLHYLKPLLINRRELKLVNCLNFNEEYMEDAIVYLDESSSRFEKYELVRIFTSEMKNGALGRIIKKQLTDPRNIREFFKRIKEFLKNSKSEIIENKTKRYICEQKITINFIINTLQISSQYLRLDYCNCFTAIKRLEKTTNLESMGGSMLEEIKRQYHIHIRSLKERDEILNENTKYFDTIENSEKNLYHTFDELVDILDSEIDAKYCLEEHFIQIIRRSIVTLNRFVAKFHNSNIFFTLYSLMCKSIFIVNWLSKKIIYLLDHINIDQSLRESAEQNIFSLQNQYILSIITKNIKTTFRKDYSVQSSILYLSNKEIENNLFSYKVMNIVDSILMRKCGDRKDFELLISLLKDNEEKIFHFKSDESRLDDGKNKMLIDLVEMFEKRSERLYNGTVFVFNSLFLEITERSKSFRFDAEKNDMAIGVLNQLKEQKVEIESKKEMKESK